MPQGTYNQSMSENSNWVGQAFMKGNGNGVSYSTASTSYVEADSKALRWQGTIPAGFNAAVQASGVASISGGSNIKAAIGLINIDPQYGQATLQFADDEAQIIFPNSSVQQSWSVSFLYPGGTQNGSPRSAIITLAFKMISAGGNSINLLNDTPAHTPSLLVQLVPSNMTSGLGGQANSPWS